MGSVAFGLPERLAADLVRQQGIKVAVETGTYNGGSTRLLASIAELVISIELSQDLHDAALRNLADLPNLTLLQGSSADVLPGVVRDLDEPALYWLDGHWCEGAAGERAQCPILAEITAIDRAKGAAQSCILIDDARFYLGPPPPPFRREDWPTITEIVDHLRAEHERCFTVLDDVIIAGPPEIQKVIDTYWLGKQWSDLVDHRNHLQRQLMPLIRARAASRRLAAVVRSRS